MCFALLLLTSWKYFYRITLNKDFIHSDGIIDIFIGSRYTFISPISIRFGILYLTANIPQYHELEYLSTSIIVRRIKVKVWILRDPSSSWLHNTLGSQFFQYAHWWISQRSKGMMSQSHWLMKITLYYIRPMLKIRLYMGNLILRNLLERVGLNLINLALRILWIIRFEILIMRIKNNTNFFIILIALWLR